MFIWLNVCVNNVCLINYHLIKVCLSYHHILNLCSTAQCLVYGIQGYPNLNFSPCEGIFLQIGLWAPLGSGTTWARSWSATCTVQGCTGAHRVCTKCTFSLTFLFVKLESWNLVWMLEFKFHQLSFKPYFEKTDVQGCTGAHRGAQGEHKVHIFPNFFVC